MLPGSLFGNLHHVVLNFRNLISLIPIGGNGALAGLVSQLSPVFSAVSGLPLGHKHCPNIALGNRFATMGALVTGIPIGRQRLIDKGKIYLRRSPCGGRQNQQSTEKSQAQNVWGVLQHRTGKSHRIRFDQFGTSTPTRTGQTGRVPTCFPSNCNWGILIFHARASLPNPVKSKIASG